MSNDYPDWARPMSEADLYREAMDYEENARYDQFDGRDEFDYCGAFADEHDFDDFEDLSDVTEFDDQPPEPVVWDDSDIPF